MGSKLVSIIIPVYNSEKHLKEALDSAIAQIWPDKEIIIVDDGSTDLSLTIAKKYENDWIKVLHQPNKGASAARNMGFKNSKGQYIQFLDADDLLSPDKISSQMAILAGTEGCIGLCSIIHFKTGENLNKLSATREWYDAGSDNTIDFLIKLNSTHETIEGYGGMIQPNAWLVPRPIIEAAGPWNEELTVDDDGEFFCRVLIQAKGIKFSPQGINYYRKFDNGQSLSGKKDIKGYQSRLLSTDLKYKYLKANNNSAIIDKIFARHYWEIGVSTYPQYKTLSNAVIAKAKQLGFTGKKYYSGKIGNLLSYILGWRIMRTLSYFKHKK